MGAPPSELLVRGVPREEIVWRRSVAHRESASRGGASVVREQLLVARDNPMARCAVEHSGPGVSCAWVR